jgi:hypothetical protein
MSADEVEHGSSLTSRRKLPVASASRFDRDQNVLFETAEALPLDARLL